MLSEFSQTEKLENYLFITNFITKILSKGKRKQYSKNSISAFKDIINTNDTRQIIEFMFQNNVNIKETIPVNYRQIQNIYKNNNNNLTLIENFLEYQLLSKEIEKLLTNNRNFLIDYLSNIFQNSSRRKGNLFKDVFKQLSEKPSETETEFLTTHPLLNNIQPLYLFEDVVALTNNEDFIYFPESDNNTKRCLDFFNIPFNNNKGRDTLLRYKGYYFLGEAKEIHEVGGGQTNQFKDLLSCVGETNIDNKLIGFGIIYGACMMTLNPYQDETDKNPSILTISEFGFNIQERLDQLIQVA